MQTNTTPTKRIKYAKSNKPNHGMTNTVEFRAYAEARRRCKRNYAKYGTRFLFGSFEQFYRELGPKPTPLHSVDRIDTFGDYAPGNIRWATKYEQTHNTRLTRSAITMKGRLTLWIKQHIAVMPSWVPAVKPALAG